MGGRSVSTDCYATRRGHRIEEFIKFLKKIDRTVPKGSRLHLTLDNYATHKTAAVKAWLEKHKRFKVNFIPTSSS